MENTTAIPIIMYNLFCLQIKPLMNHGRNTGGKGAGRPTLD